MHKVLLLRPQHNSDKVVNKTTHKTKLQYQFYLLCHIQKTNDMHIVYKIYINDIRGTIQEYINILHNIYFIAKHFMGCFRDNAKERKFCLGFFGGETLSLFCVCIYDSIMGIEQSSNRVRRMKVRLVAAVSTYYTIL